MWCTKNPIGYVFILFIWNKITFSGIAFMLLIDTRNCKDYYTYSNKKGEKLHRGTNWPKLSLLVQQSKYDLIHNIFNIHSNYSYILTHIHNSLHHNIQLYKHHPSFPPRLYEHLSIVLAAIAFYFVYVINTTLRTSDELSFKRALSFSNHITIYLPLLIL